MGDGMGVMLVLEVRRRDFSAEVTVADEVYEYAMGGVSERYIAKKVRVNFAKRPSFIRTSSPPCSISTRFSLRAE